MKISQEVFPATYEAYKNSVYSVAFNYVRNVEDAMDLTQNVFIKLLKSDMEFENDEHLKAWLIRVTCNESKNLLLKNRHISGDPLPEDLASDSGHNDNADLMNYVLKLPEIYRIPIHLFYYEDYSIRQISQALELSEATVKVRLKRGKDKLRSQLNREDWY